MTSDSDTCARCDRTAQDLLCAACGELLRSARRKQRSKETLTPEEKDAYRAYRRAYMARQRAAEREADPDGYLARRAEEQRAWREANPEKAREMNAAHNRDYRQRAKGRPEQ
ncbi:hypothetical protein ACFW6C_07370 [Streptomyces fungicidicus]|uniref:hypothetical protein n=1 Tax=Streptomyces fungicidicus TaxID=68203 RepID=UPI0036CC5C20